MRARFEKNFTVHRWFDLPNQDKFVAQHGSAVMAIATDGHYGVPDNLFTRLPDLKIVSSYGVGYDAIDVATAPQHNIAVAHTPDVLNDEVANNAIMLWLALSRRLIAAEAWTCSSD